MVATVQKEAVDKPITYPVMVKNIHSNTVNLESGSLVPGAQGLATRAEVSCFLDKYVEFV